MIISFYFPNNDRMKKDMEFKFSKLDIIERIIYDFSICENCKYNISVDKIMNHIICSKINSFNVNLDYDNKRYYCY